MTHAAPRAPAQRARRDGADAQNRAPTHAQFRQLHAQLLRYAAEIKTLAESERHKSGELDAAQQQLLRYARDLRKTYNAEKQRAQELHASYVETIQRLTHAAEYKDKETANHIQRISHYARTVALELGWTEERAQLIFDAAPMHDIGKIGVPDVILLKQGPLSAAEWAVMRRHPSIGADILAGSISPLLRMATEIAAGHHEHWDGSGYPRGLRGEAVPEAARIVMLCDIYDALRSKRPYKPALDHALSCEIILHGDGGSTRPEHFDPCLLAAFERLSNRFDVIFNDLSDH